MKTEHINIIDVGTVEIRSYCLDFDEATEKVEELAGYLKSIPQEHRDKVLVSPRFDDDYGSPFLELSVSYHRPMTDEELQARLDEQAKMEKLRELNERQLYEELKRKYDGL